MPTTTTTSFSHPIPRDPGSHYGVLNLRQFGRTFDRARPAPAFSTFEGRQHLICLIGGDASSTHATYEDVIKADEETMTLPTYRTKKDGSEGNVSHQPVRHKSAIDALRDVGSSVFGVEPELETYALCRNGAVMLSRMIWPSTIDGAGYGVLLRNGHAINGRGSASLELAGISIDTFACTNGCLGNDSVLYRAKHTLNIGEAFPRMLVQFFQDKTQSLAQQRAQRELWANTKINHDLAGTYLGLLLWKDAIGPRQYAKAKRYYKAIAGLSSPKNAEDAAAAEHFAHQFDGSLLSAYQAASAAIQRTGAQNGGFRQYGAVAHITDCIARSGGSVDSEIPEFTLEVQDFE